MASSVQISLEEALVLGDNRTYVIRQADVLGYNVSADLRAYKHRDATNTCLEKALLLQNNFPEEKWTPNRVVKAVFSMVDWDNYLFIFPELFENRLKLAKKPNSGGSRRKRRSIKRYLESKAIGFINSATIDSIFNYSEIKYADPNPFVREECMPSGMEYGTGTPFISSQEMRNINDVYNCPLTKIFIHDLPEIDKKLVDISLGGKGSDAHRISLHLPYQAIYNILKAEFGEDKVVKIDFWQKITDFQKYDNYMVRKNLLDKLIECKIEDFQLDSWKKRLSIEFQRDFGTLSDKLGIRPQILITEKLGSKSGVIDFFEYKGWTISSNQGYPSKSKSQQKADWERRPTYDFEKMEFRLPKENEEEKEGW